MVILKNDHKNIYYIRTVKSNIQADQTVNNRKKEAQRIDKSEYSDVEILGSKIWNSYKNPVNTCRKTGNTIDKVNNVKGNQKENSRY